MDFKEKFEAYGGDYASTMDKFMGDEAFYLQMLQMLAEDTCMTRLERALDAGDLAAAFDAAHELKGVSGNLSLKPLYAAVCALVEPLRAGEARDYAPLLRKVQTTFAASLALLV